MQIGTTFFDAPSGKITTTTGETRHDTCKVIYSPEGCPPETYSKLIAIGPVAKKLSQIKELRFYWQSTVVSYFAGRGLGKPFAVSNETYALSLTIF